MGAQILTLGKVYISKSLSAVSWLANAIIKLAASAAADLTKDVPVRILSL